MTMEPISQIQKFWLVWRNDGSGPVRKHWDKQSAVLEAERLAERNPGAIFVVVKSVDARMTATPAARPVLLVREEEIPF